MANRIEYVDALETQLEWHKFTLSAHYMDIWNDMEAGHWNVNEPQLYRVPVQHGEMFYVGRQFCDLIEQVSEDFPDCYLQEEWIPAPVGFVLFHHPLPLPMLAEHHRILLQEGLSESEIEHNLDTNRNLTIKAFGWIRDGASLKVACYQPVVQAWRKEPFYPVSFFTWPYGQSMATKIKEYEEKANMDGHKGQSRYVEDATVHEIKYLVTLLLLMNQRVLSAEQEPVDRHQRKRFARDVNREVKTLKVVTLRRTVSTAASDEEHRVDWTCRWIVRGHWRQQWYPSLGHHNPVWISPFVKGPEGLPVKEPSKSLFAVVR